ncbi:DUF4111 domain-containing protein [Caldibacillus lycopersici]|uniref:DUF4111 domain-containing protein n=1 Tax=Perspicuibacillus lycopersici TaxID=1325689 RepID=A0AAE3IV88_9BACI|nr:DUF4111 domain-containing protein [Perspicuibacillus lycopersici]MCU9614837.1 DUF4111 domain-containing protein [Perspicuibacillus lycopersici]
MWDDFGKLFNKETNDPDKYVIFNNGKLTFGEYYNFNPVTWWIMKQSGISLIGPNPKNIAFSIEPQQLRAYVHENMNSYWANRMIAVEKHMEELVDLPIEHLNEEIEWTVLGLLRQFYTLKESAIISKLDAGSYGLQHLPQEWHPIIKEAMDIREGKQARDNRSFRERILSLLTFANYLINYCNNSKANQVNSN